MIVPAVKWLTGIKFSLGLYPAGKMFLLSIKSWRRWENSFADAVPFRGVTKP